jgi:hypothetical protein
MPPQEATWSSCCHVGPGGGGSFSLTEESAGLRDCLPSRSELQIASFLHAASEVTDGSQMQPLIKRLRMCHNVLRAQGCLTSEGAVMG